MNNSMALNVPQVSSTMSSRRVALVDIVAGIGAVDIWGRLGWRDTKRRYRRTAFGPFWTTVSLALFVGTLGLVWSNLWHKDPRTYLPYLTSGMLCWVFFVAVCTEGSASFISYEKLIKQLRISYTLLGCAVVWRNTVVLLHNSLIFILVCIYGNVTIGWPQLLVVPGLALLLCNAAWIVVLLGIACARFRDLQQLVGNMLQISLFLTPIFWSPDQLSGNTLFFVQLNPLYHLIAVVREPLLGNVPSFTNWASGLGIAVMGWAITVAVLAKLRRRIVYWL
jgi:lipopolysaccharide transport system permease protein